MNRHLSNEDIQGLIFTKVAVVQTDFKYNDQGKENVVNKWHLSWGIKTEKGLEMPEAHAIAERQDLVASMITGASP